MKDGIRYVTALGIAVSFLTVSVLIVACDFVRFQNPFVHPSENVPVILRWKKVTGSAQVFPRSNFASTVFNNQIWIVGGQDESNDLEDLWYSPDGNEWKQATATGPVGPTQDPAFAAFNGLLFLRQNDLLYFSTDGLTWPNSIPDQFGGVFVRFAELNGELWAVDPATGDVWSSPTPSTDGSWVGQPSSASLGADPIETAVVSSDDALWVVGGEGFAAAWRYTIDQGWNKISDDEFLDRTWPEAVWFEGNLWVIGGWGDSGALNDAWFSNNGQDWTETLPDPEWPPRERFGSAVLNGKIYIFGGAEDVTTNMQTDVWYTEAENLDHFWD